MTIGPFIAGEGGTSTTTAPCEQCSSALDPGSAGYSREGKRLCPSCLEAASIAELDARGTASLRNAKKTIVVSKPLSRLVTLHPIQRLLSRAGVAATFLLSLSCTQTDEPPRRASLLEQYGELCSDPPQPFDGARAYEKSKTPSAPRKVVVFTRDNDDKAPAYRLDLTTNLEPFGARSGESDKVELVVCIDLKRKGTPTFCEYGYHDKHLLYYDMEHTVRVLEAKTGKEQLRDEFFLERPKTCPTTYAFPHDSDTVYLGADFGPTLRRYLRPLELSP